MANTYTRRSHANTSSLIPGEGPSSPDCLPSRRPAGKCQTTHAANKARLEFHTDLTNRAACMPKGPRANHTINHSLLQRAYMVVCAGGGRDGVAMPDPLVLESLKIGLLQLDVMLYEKCDLESVARLLMPLKMKKETIEQLEGVVVSCGELRGNEAQMRRVGWDINEIPRR